MLSFAGDHGPRAATCPDPGQTGFDARNPGTLIFDYHTIISSMTDETGPQMPNTDSSSAKLGALPLQKVHRKAGWQRPNLRELCRQLFSKFERPGFVRCTAVVQLAMIHGHGVR